MKSKLCFQLKADSVYTEAESGYGDSSDANLKAPEIVIDPPSAAHGDSDKEEDKDGKNNADSSELLNTNYEVHNFFTAPSSRSCF